MNIHWFFLNFWQIFLVSCTFAFDWGSVKSHWREITDFTACCRKHHVREGFSVFLNEPNLKENKCLFCASNCRSAVRMKRTGSASNRPSLPSWTCSAAWSAFTASTLRGAGLGKHPERNHLFLGENLWISFSWPVSLPVCCIDGAAAQNLHVPLVWIM